MSTAAKRHYAVAIIVICFAGFMAGCVAISPIPNCPTDDAYQYMACAKPTVGWLRGLSEEQKGKYFYEMVDAMDMFCTDARTEWLPALDKGVRDAYPEVREYLRDGQFFHDFVSEMYAIEGQRFESLKGRDLHRAVVALFVWDIVFLGGANNDGVTGNCTDIFQRLGDGGVIEALERMQQWE